MLPTPGTGELLLIALLVAIVFFGEKVGALGDALGRLVRGGRQDDPRIDVRRADPEA